MLFVDGSIAVAAIATFVQRSDIVPAGWMGTVEMVLGSATVVLLTAVLLQQGAIRERLKHTPTKQEMDKSDTEWRHAVHNDLVATMGKLETDLGSDITRLEVEVRELRGRFDRMAGTGGT